MRGLGINSIFSERIKALRLKVGISQKELAGALQISQAALGNYERGERNPDIDLLAKMAIYFNVTADYLLGLSNVPTQDMEYYEKISGENQSLQERLQRIEQLCQFLDK